MWWKFCTLWREMWTEVLHRNVQCNCLTWPVTCDLRLFYHLCLVLSDHWSLSLPSLWSIPLSAGHKLGTNWVKTHPQRGINTMLFSSDIESSLCNRPACCSVNAPLVQVKNLVWTLADSDLLPPVLNYYRIFLTKLLAPEQGPQYLSLSPHQRTWRPCKAEVKNFWKDLHRGAPKALFGQGGQVPWRVGQWQG